MASSSSSPHPPQEGRAGTISTIRVENLMCHEHMQVELGPDVNVLTGQNGSGKSAVLTALCLCLGFTAKRTNRADHVSELIKTSEGGRAHQALAAVTLRNTGGDAYRPDAYGASITVERVLTSTGGAALRLRSEDGRVVSRDKAELARILDYFNLEVKNRCVVMTQDDARKSLLGSGEVEAFRMFMGATLLDNVREGLQTVEHHLTAIQREIGLKSRDVRKLEGDVTILRNKVHDLELAADLYQQSEELRQQLAWSHVYDCDAAKENAEQSCKVLQEEGLSSLRAVEEVAASARDAVAQCEEVLRGRLVESSSVDTAAGELLERQRDLEADLSAADRRLAAANCGMAASREREEEMQSRFLPAGGGGDPGGLRDEEADAEVLRLEHQVVGADAAQRAAQALMEQMRRREKDADGELRSCEGRLRQHTACLKELAHQRRALDVAAALQVQLESGDLRRFGRNVPELCRAIRQRSREFHKVPVGPIGACLSLSEDRWAAAAEVALKSVMPCFVASDMHDKELLGSLARACGSAVPTILVRSFTAGAYHIPSGRRPRCTHPTLDQVVLCESDLVRNVLVDLARADQVVLAPDFRAGRALVFGRSPVARECILPDGTRLSVRGRCEIITPPPARLVVPRLASSAGERGRVAAREVEEERRALRAREEEAAGSKEGLVRAAHEARALLERARRARREAEGRALELDHLAGEAREGHRLAQAEAARRAEAARAAVVLIAREGAAEELADVAEEIGSARERAQGALEERGRIAAGVAALEREVARLREHNREKLTGVETAREELRIAGRESMYYEEQVREKRLRVEQLSAEAERAAGERREREKLASQVCNQDKVGRQKLQESGVSTELLSSRLQRVEARLHMLPSAAVEAAAANKGGGGRPDVDKLKRRLSRVTARYEKAVEGLENAGEVVHLLQRGLEGRWRLLEKNKVQAAQQAALDFNTVMAGRGHAGHLEVDFSDSKLRLVVRLNGHNSSSSSKGGGGGSSAALGPREGTTTKEGADGGGRGGAGGRGGGKRKLLQEETDEPFRERVARRRVAAAHPLHPPESRVVATAGKDKAGGAAAKGVGVGTSASDVPALETLSGGERSFSTLAFALALGGSMESPFRAMDEPDVFMDPVNRKVSMELLVGSKAVQGTQLLYITPHNIAVDIAPFVKMHRMQPPRPASGG